MTFAYPFQYLGDIEEHLGVTIDQVDRSLNIPTNEFDGKVVYGAKLKNTGMFCKRQICKENTFA